MPRDKTPFIIAVILVVALTGHSLYRHVSYIRDLEASHYRNYSNWVTIYLSDAQDLDRAVAVALVATDEQTLKRALEQAHESAQSLRRHLSHPYTSTVATLSYISWWVLGDVHGSSYIAYLTSMRGSSPLNEVEIDNLLLIRQRTDMARNAVLTAERSLLTPGLLSNKVRTTPWKRLGSDPNVITAVQSLGDQLRQLPYVGQNDSAFHQAIAEEHKRLTKGSFTKGLAQSGEPAYSQDAMQAKAEEFLRTLSKGPFTYEVMSGGSSGGAMGNTSYFSFMDHSIGNRYVIAVTEVGGHIGGVSLYKGRTNPGVEEAQAMGKSVLSKWAEFERTTLVPLEGSDFRYACKSEGVLAPNKSVSISLGSRRDDYVYRISANSFFDYYLTPITHTPTVTPEEAIASLHPTLRATGSPSLQDIEGTLVYAIPVSGVERIKLVYINALTGNYEGIEYER